MTTAEHRTADSLKAYCEAHLAETFYTPWTDSHYRFFEAFAIAISVPEHATVDMGRGEGATSLISAAAVFAAITGRCRYIRIVTVRTQEAEHAIRRIEGMLSPSVHKLTRSRIELANGVAIEAAGILSSHRGCVHRDRSGKHLRPDLWLIDWSESDAHPLVSTLHRRIAALMEIVSAAGGRCAVVRVRQMNVAGIVA